MALRCGPLVSDPVDRFGAKSVCLLNTEVYTYTHFPFCDHRSRESERGGELPRFAIDNSNYLINSMVDPSVQLAVHYISC